MWKTYKFQELVLKTPKVRGIQTKEYQESGKYPVIDQGSQFIAGYSDNEDSLYTDSLPIIVFGDHTLSLKYVEFPFCVGADGTQIIKPNEEVIIGKYLYYAIMGLKIKSLGYSRHFKVLKEATFRVPEIEEQKRIVRELDAADALRQKRKQAIALLDDYLKAVFLEMFGDPVENPKGWGTKRMKEISTKIGSGATPKGGKNAYLAEGISLIRSLNIHDNEFLYRNLAFINEKQAKALDGVSLEKMDVLLNITGASVCRCAIVPENVLPARVNQHVSIIRAKSDLLNPIYLLHLMISDSYKFKLLKTAKAGGATREAITKQQIESFVVPVPPIELQNNFSEVVKRVELMKEKMNTQVEQMESNFNALMQNSFKV